MDVRLRGAWIDAIEGVGRLHAAADEQTVDLAGHVLLPALVEPHAHLDKAFLAERLLNPTGDLMGAITVMQNSRHLITVEDTIERAERAVRLMVSNGATLIRTHADATQENGLTSIEALVEVKRRVQDVCEMQIAVLVSWPLTGTEGAKNRSLLRDALAVGGDVVGGCPHLDDDPAGANDALIDIAAETGRDIDVHTDETLDPSRLTLEHLARRVLETGFAHRVTASHCVSLGVQTETRQREVADLVAEAGISVVALPQTNLFLQGRSNQTAMPRALTAVKALREAGVNVCAGADNLQDPFNPMGRGDPLETAALMVMAAHLRPDEALHCVSGAARRALTGGVWGVQVGDGAELVAIAADTTREALAYARQDRTVIHNGRLVSGAHSHAAAGHETKSS